MEDLEREMLLIAQGNELAFNSWLFANFGAHSAKA